MYCNSSKSLNTLLHKSIQIGEDSHKCSKS